MPKRMTWWQAMEVLGISDRSMQRGKSATAMMGRLTGGAVGRAQSG